MHLKATVTNQKIDRGYYWFWIQYCKLKSRVSIYEWCWNSKIHETIILWIIGHAEIPGQMDICEPKIWNVFKIPARLNALDTRLNLTRKCIPLRITVILEIMSQKTELLYKIFNSIKQIFIQYMTSILRKNLERNYKIFRQLFNYFLVRLFWKQRCYKIV